MFVIGTIIVSIIGYLLGSVSFSILVVKLRIQKDIRKLGSKNAGATNASRVLGKKWGLAITFLDAFKIIITAFIAFGFSCIPSIVFNEISYYIPCFFALLGHCYPIYHKFKGGKAVSCLIGLLIVTNWVLFLIFTIVWWTLIFTIRKVSVSSIFGAVAVMIFIWVPTISFIGYEHWTINTYFAYNGFNFFTTGPGINGQWKNALYFNTLHRFSNPDFYDSFFTIQLVVTLSVLVLIFKHKQNIIRIVKKKEPNFF